MKIAIGCDHTVVDLKEQIIEYLKSKNIIVLDCGCYNKVSTHYPIFGRSVGILVSKKKVDFGICLCGTGIGISNACNKVKNVRCVLATNILICKKARELFDANVLAFGGRIISIGLIQNMIDVFLSTQYLGKYPELVEAIDNQIKVTNTSKTLFNSLLKQWYQGFFTDGIEKEETELPRY
ncbi:RpiB/LacA/LacB family sugar-phosphate isomerase [symbiont of Argiope bruennichi]|uniref:RpiB/LacA/LacB family sugar-phosphate isomerase n=1 Tax=symbiont of Argiope bruennichi TaxID=2810479 RepID=UPI003DA3DA4E